MTALGIVALSSQIALSGLVADLGTARELVEVKENTPANLKQALKLYDAALKDPAVSKADRTPRPRRHGPGAASGR